MSTAKRFDLTQGARQAMLDAGFLPEIPAGARKEAASLVAASALGAGIRDLRSLPWSSINNDESRDLDQIEMAETLPDHHCRVRVGIADVDALVHRGSALDAYAAHNTCTVYTGAAIFPMLPESLSTDRTSLGEGADRLALVVEMDVDPQGNVASAVVYQAAVRNHAKLAYDGVGAWLEGTSPAPPKVAASRVLQEQLRLQDRAARAMKKVRHERGALDLETIEARAVVKDGAVLGIELTKKSPARALIEDFMIAANGAIARFLESRGASSIRRVVKAPERWQRIVALARQVGEELPAEPSSRALSAFLDRRKLAAPDTFADLVTQRLVKAALARAPAPYGNDDLAAIAAHCTQKENDARKVERTTRKQAAAVFLGDRIGQEFDAIVTGAAEKGTFARLLDPPAEGRIVEGEAGLDVGDRVRVRLVATEPGRGFIDFVRARGA